MSGPLNSEMEIRVLFLILEYAPMFSGHGVYLRRLFPVLNSYGVKASVLTANFGEGSEREKVDGTCVHRFRYPLGWRRATLWAALRVVHFLVRHRREFDVLHINGAFDVFGIITVAGRLLGKTVVTQLVLLGSDDPETFLRTYRLAHVRLWLMARTHCFLCISPQLADSCRNVDIPNARIECIPQGVDTRRFLPATFTEKTLLRRQLGLPSDGPLASFVGAIIHRKGVDMLVEAWKTVQARRPDAALIFVGPFEFAGDDDGVAEHSRFVARIREEIDRYGLSIHFQGRRDNVEVFLRASDVFVLPSRSEGFGNVIIEAMASGIPTVVTPMDGVASVSVVDGETGFIVDGPGAIARAILELINNPERAVMMGTRARQRAEELFSIQRVAGLYAATYRELTAGIGRR